jgi:hypothetical protein
MPLREKIFEWCEHEGNGSPYKHHAQHDITSGILFAGTSFIQDTKTTCKNWRSVMQIQYITNEQGQKTGVLLDVATYQQLLERKPTDPDLLVGISEAELEALATSQLAPASQLLLAELLAKQKDDTLTAAESEELDKLLSQIDQLTILKTRARYTLNQSFVAP